MAKKAQQQKQSRTWERKTKTQKGRRCGIYKKFPAPADRDRARARVLTPDGRALRLQTPFTVIVGQDKDGNDIHSVTRVGFQGMTQMRHAFEQIQVDGLWPPLMKQIARSARRGCGTFRASGWRVLRDNNQPRRRRRV